MSAVLVFVGGILVGIVLTILFPKLIISIPTGYVSYDHQVGEREHDTHEHRHDAKVPRWVQRAINRRAFKRCVYGKLGKTPEQVWLDEVRYIGEEVALVDLTANPHLYGECVSLVKLMYDIDPTVVPMRPWQMEKIARSQLTRRTTAHR